MKKDRLLKAAYLRFRELVVNTVTEIELIVNDESFGPHRMIACITDPALGWGTPFLPFSSIVHSLPHLLLFFYFFSCPLYLFSFFGHPFPCFQNSHHSISRLEFVGGDQTWV